MWWRNNYQIVLERALVVTATAITKVLDLCDRILSRRVAGEVPH